jgi:hypothetical protein
MLLSLHYVIIATLCYYRYIMLLSLHDVIIATLCYYRYIMLLSLHYVIIATLCYYRYIMLLSLHLITRWQENFSAAQDILNLCIWGFKKASEVCHFHFENVGLDFRLRKMYQTLQKCPWIIPLLAQMKILQVYFLSVKQAPCLWAIQLPRTRLNWKTQLIINSHLCALLLIQLITD